MTENTVTSPPTNGRAVRRGIFDAPIDINSHGFRALEHAYDKPAGTRRVVLLDDSFIEALQAPFVPYPGPRLSWPTLLPRPGDPGGLPEAVALAVGAGLRPRSGPAVSEED